MGYPSTGGSGGGGSLDNLVEDLSPELGADLDVLGFDIVSSTSGITLTPNGTSDITLGTLVLDADATIGAGQDNYVLTYDHSAGKWGPEAAVGGADTALSNLASVAINTTLVSDTDATDDLGSSSIAWKRLYLEAGTATDIPLNIEGATSQSGNYINVTSQGGSAGDKFHVTKDGYVGIGSTMEVRPYSTTGLYFTRSGNKIGSVILAGSGKPGGYTVPAAYQYNFSPSTDPTTTGDTGIGRVSAGLLKVTDGTTGLGNIVVAGGTPASASATGVQGQILWDSSYIYICSATDTWLRVAIATW